jgi:hypothetical protein
MRRSKALSSNIFDSAKTCAADLCEGDDFLRVKEKRVVRLRSPKSRVKCLDQLENLQAKLAATNKSTNKKPDFLGISTMAGLK